MYIVIIITIYIIYYQLFAKTNILNGKVNK